MYREKIISNIKIQLENLESMKTDLEAQISELKKTVDILQDESKLGTSSTFDFGKDEQSKWIKNIEKKLIRGILKLKKLQKNNEELQEQGEAFTTNLLDDSVDKE